MRVYSSDNSGYYGVLVVFCYFIYLQSGLNKILIIVSTTQEIEQVMINSVDLSYNKQTLESIDIVNLTATGK